MSKFSAFVFCLIVLLNTNKTPLCSQDFIPRDRFTPPLEIPLFLSGTYGELRSNHFHAGLDFRTAGVIGQKVLATADGYVCRVSVSGSGYGNGLYVQHPGGYQSVYGHLNAFRQDIAEWCREEQYRQKSFEVELTPDSIKFPVKKGDLIAFSGNTGASAGPHLHFEIRESSSDSPLNPLLFNFPIRDAIAPVIRRLVIYGLNEKNPIKPLAKKTNYIPRKIGSIYKINEGKILEVKSLTGFGLVATDASEGSTLRNGPYKISVRLDSVLIFVQSMDRFPLEDTKTINSLMDYGEFIRTGQKVNTLWIEPNNRLPFYKNTKADGLVILRDTLPHIVRIEVSDFHTNSSVLEFRIRTRNPGEPDMAVRQFIEDLNISNLLKIKWNQPFFFSDTAIQLNIPRNAVYQNLNFHYQAVSPDSSRKYTLHRIGDEEIPLNKAIQVKIQAKGIPESLREKAMLAKMSSSGRKTPAGGHWKDGWVTGQLSSFGNYCIAIDSVPPVISPVRISVPGGVISTRIRDNFSGIASYQASVDQEWILMEWDAKTGILRYVFDKTKLPRTGKKRSWGIEVTDQKGNVSRASGSFMY